jgi:hypothetical protein
MTAWTQRHNVINRMCVLWIIELTNWFDMMNMWVCVQFVTNNSTTLARVSVPIERFLAYFPPLPTIFDLFSFPTVMIFSTKIFRHPLVMTFVTTESNSSTLDSRPPYREIDLTLFTDYIYTFNR